MRWWINGSPARHIDADDRGFGYADGLFETMALRAGAVRFLDRHLARLHHGCQRLQIDVSGTDWIRTLDAALVGRHDGVVKLVVSRGPGERGYHPVGAGPVTWAVGISEGVYHPPPATGQVICCETPVATSPAVAGMKTLGKLEHVLARAEWQDPRVMEGLMRSADGRLVGGTASNIFMVAADGLYTPRLDEFGVHGIMRQRVMEAAMTLAIPCQARDMRPGDLDEADEVFITNALAGLRPVTAFGARRWAVGPVTRRLCRYLTDAGVGECAAWC